MMSDRPERVLADSAVVFVIQSSPGKSHESHGLAVVRKNRLAIRGDAANVFQSDRTKNRCRRSFLGRSLSRLTESLTAVLMNQDSQPSLKSRPFSAIEL